MSEARVKTAIANKKLRCPNCGEPILKYEKYLDTADSVWDGAGDTNVEFSGCKVTLVCGNGACDWKERTEYWQNFAED